MIFQEELNKIIKDHKLYLNGTGGKCAELSGANLSRADLKDADLRGVDLSDADLRNADLRGADLFNANLTGVNLEYASLSGVNLRYATLGNENLYTKGDYKFLTNKGKVIIWDDVITATYTLEDGREFWDNAFVHG